jgi:tetratricopeptide (TPR) repeat protein
MDATTPNVINSLRERVHALCQAEKDGEALDAANEAVEQSRASAGADPEAHAGTLASVLEIRGGLHRDAGRHEEACDDYRQAIEQLERLSGRDDQMGRLHTALGAAYDTMANPHRAAILWQQAVVYFERSEPPLLREVAALSNNLGFLKKADGDMDSAESHFLKALEILHGQFGPDHEETAAVANNLGALYHAAGFHEQAREMHNMALDARRKLFGEEHPETAQSHNNLALALLQGGDRSWARRHFEKALAGFEALGGDYADDLEAVAENYCDFLREEGERELADLIAGRVRQVLGRP